MIKYYNRKTKKYEIEKVAGGKYLNWIYSSPIGMTLSELFIKKKLFTKLYGNYCDSKRSKNKINNFITDFNLDMSICKDTVENFNCFNDFFIRELTSEARPIDMSSEAFISPGDGKLLAYENIDMNNIVQVKGITYSLKELLQNNEIASRYEDGTCLILRLCPTDYHRFHFLDSGVCEETNKIKGYYYSVNPVALQKVNKLFCANKREWSIFHSDNFGDVLYVEVGATCVGSIIQSYTPGKKVNKGDEKGYFKFGGSTVVLFFEKGKIRIDKDITEHTHAGIETAVLMGETIGTRL